MKAHCLKYIITYPTATVVSVIFLLFTVIFSSCSSKKNTAATRQWEAFNTRYNVYFNGKEHLKETLSEMERNYEDDYSTRLLTHPAVARGNDRLPQPSGDFTRTIEKMQKAIQLHSISRKPARRSTSAEDKAFRAREEFNPFLHNAWLTLGKAQYYNGDFIGAASTFLYTSKHFYWMPEVVTEARLWQARCYCALDWNYEAENILHLVKEKDLSDRNLQFLYNLVEADYLIRTNRLKEALPYLQYAAKESTGTQKNRLWFLLGQINEQTGNREGAYGAFKKAAGGISTPYRMKFNARIRQSEVYGGGDITKEVKSLQSLVKYERNREYLDQIYYAIGNLYLSKKDTTAAIKNYRLAVENSRRREIDMALAQLALGNIFFAQRKYVEAQPCFSQALPFLPDDYPDYNIIRKRSDVLDELSFYAGNISLQDSLIRLSELPREEQIKVARSLAYELVEREKREREAAQREEFMANQPDGNVGGMSSPFPGAQINADKSWYFYNTYAKNVGKTEFQRKWGARKLEDDWRRKNKHNFSFDEFNDEEPEEDGVTDKTLTETTKGEKEMTAQNREKDPHYPEYYLKQIPSTPEQIEAANDIIQEGMFNIGLILKDKLEDYPKAREEFLLLEERYPENVYSLEVYYNLYLMAARENDKKEAAIWRDKILTRFPDSNYALAMRDPNYFDNLRRMHEVQERIYERAYAAYLDNQNDTVHALTKEMETKYPLSPILPKFVFINSLSYFTEGNREKFQEGLTELLQRWPETDMTEMASAILRGLKSGRALQSTGINARGMIWSTRLSSEEEQLLNEEGLPANFENEPDSPQYLVLAFPLESVNPNRVLYDVARFNFSTFLVKDFDLEQMSFSNIGLLIVKGFQNLKQLEHYRTMMERADLDLGPEVTPVMISKSNFELLLREGRTFEEYFRFREESDAEQAESRLLEEIDAD